MPLMHLKVGSRQPATALTARRPLKANPRHWEAAEFFQADETLISAIEVALTVQAPLLLTGEPGTGKTLIAYYLAWHYRLGDDAPAEDGRPGWASHVYPLHVRSTTVWRDLLYDFDAVRYFRESHQAGGSGISRKACVTKGPLWRAYDDKGGAVVLIDEIDKAPRDFPNDLLNVLDQGWFRVPEYETPDAPEHRVWAPEARPPIIITSNSERRLPKPFLRRCIFHHIELTEGMVERIVGAHVEAGHFPRLELKHIEAAQRHFWDIRRKPGQRKPPTTSELLVWLAAINSMAPTAIDRLLGADLAALPALSALVKDGDDLRAL